MTLKTFDMDPKHFLDANFGHCEGVPLPADPSVQQCLLCGGTVKEVTETGCFCCLNHLEQWLCLRGYRFPEQ